MLLLALLSSSALAPPVSGLLCDMRCRCFAMRIESKGEEGGLGRVQKAAS